MGDTTEIIDGITIGVLVGLVVAIAGVVLIPSRESLSPALQNQLIGALIVIIIFCVLYLLSRILPSPAKTSEEDLEPVNPSTTIPSSSASTSENMDLLLRRTKDTELYDMFDRNIEQHKSEIDSWDGE